MPLNFAWFDRKKDESGGNPDDMLSLERQVRSDVQARVDQQNLDRALTSFISTDTIQSPSTQQQQQRQRLGQSQFAVAVASGVAAGAASFVATHSLVTALMASLGVYYVAARDPVTEDDLAGSAARIIGRYTLDSVETATPKVKALARTALTGEEEILKLKSRIEALEVENAQLGEENAQLQLWKRRRAWVDDNSSKFNLTELKEKARDKSLPVGGTKAQLLMRLVEAGVVDLDE